MCAGSSVVVVYVLHTAVGGDELQNWEKRLLFCSSYSVLPFFVEASHIYPEEGEINSLGQIYLPICKGDLIFL